MTDPSNNRLIIVGVLLGAHGVRGDIRIKSFTETPEDFFKYAPFFDIHGEKILEVESFRVSKKQFIVSPRHKTKREYWEQLKGTKLCVPRTVLNAPEENEYFVEDLVGMSAQSPKGRSVGVVKSVYNFGAGDLVEIQSNNNIKLLIPFTKEEVPTVNIAEGYIIVKNLEDWAVDNS